jgi:hypothetical protein
MLQLLLLLLLLLWCFFIPVLPPPGDFSCDWKVMLGRVLLLFAHAPQDLHGLLQHA